MRPQGGFGLIMADCPWHFKVRSEKTGAGKSAQAQYDCMDLEDIKAMPVSALAADDCILWLWATGPLLPQALEVMDAWGFEYKSWGAWSKRNPETGKQAFGTGYILRCAGEPFLIGTRGKPKTARTERNVIEGARREHSRKPDEAFASAERLMPGVHRIELFSRQPRRNWTVWGNESEKFGDPVPMDPASEPPLSREDYVLPEFDHPSLF